MRRRWVSLALGLTLGACSLVTLTDPYGNTYGDYYNNGYAYNWQLGVCEHEIVDNNVASAARKRYMRCCMWRHGVPIDDAATCEAG